jgi:hypothetical protein
VPRHPGEPPAVREDEFSIEIDMKRGKWPFLKALWGQDKHGRTRLIFIADANEGGQVVGQSQNVGIVALSKKKARRLAEFILRSIDEIPD